jgi:phosphatidate cytidylyltransferase
VKKLIQRLLVFFISLPLLVFIVVFLPQKNHLVINIVVIIFSSLGAVEFADMLNKKNNPILPVEAAILGAISPVAMTLTVSFDIAGQVTSAAFILGASWILISRVFSPERKLENFVSHAAAGLAVMMYPGHFLVWIIRMALWSRSDMIILMFLLTVIVNDSVAWAAGMLFGKNNRGIVPASPNKSAAGFIGGFTASVLAGVGGALFIPGVFHSTKLPPLLAGLILGLLSGVAGSLGDLGESVMKRSAGIKDSGALIPGRGGVLDSIDSIALAAPVYYVSYWLLFG